MPLHDYRCEQCGWVNEKYFHTSDKVPSEIQCECGARAIKLFSCGRRRDCSGYPYVEENFDDKPIVVESPEHRKKLMKERGLEDWRNPRWRGHPGSWF